MNNLAPMKNCPGGVQGNLNWMPGYIKTTDRKTFPKVFIGEYYGRGVYWNIWHDTEHCYLTLCMLGNFSCF